MGSIIKAVFNHIIYISLLLHSVETTLIVPDDFKATLFANNLEAPRQIAEGEKGYIFVGSKKA